MPPPPPPNRAPTGPVACTMLLENLLLSLDWTVVVAVVAVVAVVVCLLSQSHHKKTRLTLHGSPCMHCPCTHALPFRRRPAAASWLRSSLETIEPPCWSSTAPVRLHTPGGNGAALLSNCCGSVPRRGETAGGSGTPGLSAAADRERPKVKAFPCCGGAGKPLVPVGLEPSALPDWPGNTLPLTRLSFC